MNLMHISNAYRQRKFWIQSQYYAHRKTAIYSTFLG